MTNKKNTKRALLSAIMALLLCFAMLLGTTFAWFTDSVTSGSNIIQSGTLDVDLVDANGASMEGQIIEFVTADGRAQSEILWEPGCTYKTEPVYVVNKGSLALKYEVIINGIVGNEKLLEVIEWTVTVGDIVTPLADLRYVLAAGATSEAIVLTGHMKEEAGNEYQGLKVNGISISVVATQLSEEADSFNNQYDALATYMNKNADDEWEIESLGQLIYFAKTVNEGKDYAGETVVLTKDINLAGLNWAPIGNWDYAFAGTFDGQGHTVSNMTIIAPTGEGVGFFGVAAGANIKGLTLDNVNVTAYSMAAAVVGAAYPATITDCHVTGDVKIVTEWAYVAGIAGYCYYGTQVADCSVIADGTGLIKSETRNAVGGITAWLLEGDHKITNCQVKNIDLVGWTNIGGITGFVHYSNTIDGCTVENVTITKTRLDGHPGLGLISGGFSYNANKSIALTNNSLKNITLNGTAVYKESANYLYGSEYGGADYSNFVLSRNTEAGIVNNVVYAQGAVTKVASVADLQNALNNASNDTQTVIQFTNDIAGNIVVDQNPSAKIVIDGNGKVFDGEIVVDGNSATITSAGLTIQNVVFKADSIDADACINLGDGTTATRYTCNVTIKNCTFDVADAVGIKSYTGGDKNLTIIDCTATSRAHSLAQLKGIDGVLVKDCTVNSIRGINFNNSLNVVVENCTIDVQKYAVRFGESDNTTVENFAIIDSTIVSDNVDGDAAIVLRAGAKNANLTITNTTITAGTAMSGHEGANVVIQ